MPNTMKGIKRISGRSGKSAQFETEEQRKKRMERDFPSGDKEPTTKAAGGRTSMKKQTKMARGGKMPMAKMKEGGKLPMVEKDGQMVPAFAADGEGKMARGGKTKMARGGKAKMARGGASTVKKMNRGGGIDGCAMRGKTRGKVT